MSENPFIEKRQRRRKASGINLTMRHLLGLIVLSLVTYGAFRFWVGNPMESLCDDNCESMYSLLAWVLAFAMVFGVIIAAGAVIGVIVSLVKRRSADQHTDFASRFDSKPENKDTPPSEEG